MEDFVNIRPDFPALVIPQTVNSLEKLRHHPLVYFPRFQHGYHPGRPLRGLRISTNALWRLGLSFVGHFQANRLVGIFAVVMSRRHGMHFITAPSPPPRLGDSPRSGIKLIGEAD